MNYTKQASLTDLNLSITYLNNIALKLKSSRANTQVIMTCVFFKVLLAQLKSEHSRTYAIARLL